MYPGNNFFYQQLQYCPRRNVPSISKKKMFDSTVSNYDPVTGRSVLLQFCSPVSSMGSIGPTGATGAAGKDGATGPTGSVYNPAGIWVSGTAYPVNTLAVSPIDRNTYISRTIPVVVNTTSDPSINAPEWELFTSRGYTGAEFWPLVRIQGGCSVDSPTSASILPLPDPLPDPPLPQSIIQSVSSYYAGTDVVRARWKVSNFIGDYNYVWIGLTNGLTFQQDQGGWWFFTFSKDNGLIIQYDVQNNNVKFPYTLNETVFEMSISNETINWIVDGVVVRSIPNPDTLKVYKFQIFGLEVFDGASTYDNIAVYPLLVGPAGPTGPTGSTGPDFSPLVSVQGTGVITSPTSVDIFASPVTVPQPIIQSVSSYYAETDIVRARWQVQNLYNITTYMWIGLTNGLTLSSDQSGWWFFAFSISDVQTYQYSPQYTIGANYDYTPATTIFEMSITNETINWIVNGVVVKSIPNPDTLKVYKFQIYGLDPGLGTGTSTFNNIAVYPLIGNPIGNTGPTGPTGDAGPTGDKGVTGDIGAPILLTTSGTYTVTQNSLVMVMMSGGGGGGSAGTYSGSQWVAGGGGGSGQLKEYDFVLPANTTITYTIGGGGAGGSSGNGATGGNTVITTAAGNLTATGGSGAVTSTGGSGNCGGGGGSVYSSTGAGGTGEYQNGGSSVGGEGGAGGGINGGSGGSSALIGGGGGGGPGGGGGGGRAGQSSTTVQYTTPTNTPTLVSGGATSSTVTVTVIGGGGGGFFPYSASAENGGNGAVATYTFTNVTIGTPIIYFVGSPGDIGFVNPAGGGFNSYVTIGATTIFAGGGGGAGGPGNTDISGDNGNGEYPGAGGAPGQPGGDGGISPDASVGTRIGSYGNGGISNSSVAISGIVVITMDSPFGTITAGGNATWYGAGGGGGAAQNEGQSPQPGGNGAAGYTILTILPL